MTPDVLQNLDENFAIGEAFDLNLGQFLSDDFGDLFTQLWVCCT